MKEGLKKFLGVLNNKPVIGAMIFIMLSLITVWAGNVVIKNGNVVIDDNLNSSGVLYVNSSSAIFDFGEYFELAISHPGVDTTKIGRIGETYAIGINDGISIGTYSDSAAECALKVRGGLYVGNTDRGTVGNGIIYAEKQIEIRNNDSEIVPDSPGNGVFFVSKGALYYMGSSGTITKIANA